MGYFANGTEGDNYEQKYCRHCVHYQGCAVWLLHFNHNYEECNNLDSFLHVLIPRKGYTNDKCRMFWEKKRC